MEPPPSVQNLSEINHHYIPIQREKQKYVWPAISLPMTNQPTQCRLTCFSREGNLEKFTTLVKDPLLVLKDIQSV